VTSALTLLGLGYGLFASPNMNAIMNSVEQKYYNSASGATATMRVFGQMTSMVLVTIVFSLFLGGMEISSANLSNLLFSFKLALGVSTAFCLIAVFISMARGNVRGIE